MHSAKYINQNENSISLFLKRFTNTVRLKFYELFKLFYNNICTRLAQAGGRLAVFVRIISSVETMVAKSKIISL